MLARFGGLGRTGLIAGVRPPRHSVSRTSCERIVRRHRGVPSADIGPERTREDIPSLLTGDPPTAGCPRPGSTPRRLVSRDDGSGRAMPTSSFCCAVGRRALRGRVLALRCQCASRSHELGTKRDLAGPERMAHAIPIAGPERQHRAVCTRRSSNVAQTSRAQQGEHQPHIPRRDIGCRPSASHKTWPT